MEVRMCNRLAGGGADIDPEVISVGRVVFFKVPANQAHQIPYRCLFPRCELEEILDMPAGHDEHVPGTDRIPIGKGGRKLAAQ
jgi:hypothetical protein